MSSKILKLDLHEAARSGVYPAAADDLETLAADAHRAGLEAIRINLEGCAGKADLLDRLAGALAVPGDFGRNWDALADSLRDLSWLPASGYALLFAHAGALRAAEPEAYAMLREILVEAAASWKSRGARFFAFLDLPDNAPRDAAIDA